MKRLLTILLTAATLLPAHSQDVCRVSGSMPAVKGDAKLYIVSQRSEFVRDTVMTSAISNGRFSFQVPEKMLGEEYIVMVDGHRISVPFIAEKGNVSIDVDFSQPYPQLTLSGTPSNDQYNAYMRYTTEVGKWQQAVGKRQREGNYEGQPIDIITEGEKMKTRFKDSLALANPTSIAPLLLYHQILPIYKYDQLEALLAKMSPTLKANRYYKAIADKARKLKIVSPGVEAPDFEVYDAKGGKIRLSSFRGKYVLLDFWASWCAPCRKETVHTRELYKEFHPKGLEVFSLSLDDNKQAWLKAIEQDQMVWHNGCQLLKGASKTPVAQTYCIEGIPAIWLIDPEGKIVAEGVRGEKLTELCREIFK